MPENTWTRQAMAEPPNNAAGLAQILGPGFGSTGFLAAVADNVSEGILITDAPITGVGHTILFANAAMANMSGSSKEQLIGASFPVFEGARIDDHTASRVQTCLMTGSPFTGRIIYKSTADDPRHVDWRITPLHDESGKVLAWISVQTDLTTRLKLERENRELDARINQILATTGDGVFVWDLETDAVSYSEQLRQMLGVSGTELEPLISSYFKSVGPKDRNRVIAEVQRSVKSKSTFDCEHEVALPTGELRLVHLRGKTVTSRATGKSRVIAVIEDISGQRKLERRLLQAEEIANIGSWEVDLIRDTVYWSPQVFRIHGYEPNAFVPTLQMGIEAYHPNDRKMVEESVQEAVKKGLPFQFEAVIVRPDGSERNVFSQGFVDFSDDGTPTGIFGVFTDRTEDKAREAHLTKVQRMDALGNFVGGVAHDVNNLLNVILGNLEVLEDSANTEQQERKIDAALTATLQGAELMHSLLAFAKRAPLRATNVDATTLVEEMLPLLRRVMGTSVALSFHHPACTICVHCDPTMLEACIMNLVINSRDALPEGGTIRILVDLLEVDDHVNAQLGADIPAGNYASISVNDDGVGMSADQLRRAHEPFFTTKSGGRGTGLGLARVLGFAEQSGGVFRLYSEQGQGTSAKILLPLTPVSRERIDTPRTSPEAPKVMPNGRVLLVEDQASVSDILAEILSKAGLDVATATSGDEAFARFGVNFDFDVVVTDVVMPGKLQGPDLIRALRDCGKEFPAIVISGYPRDDTGSKQTDNELDTRLTKPVSKATLLNAVRAALSQVEGI